MVNSGYPTIAGGVASVPRGSDDGVRALLESGSGIDTQIWALDSE
jgi:hypothetical protein